MVDAIVKCPAQAFLNETATPFYNGYGNSVDSYYGMAAGNGQGGSANMPPKMLTKAKNPGINCLFLDARDWLWYYSNARGDMFSVDSGFSSHGEQFHCGNVVFAHQGHRSVNCGMLDGHVQPVGSKVQIGTETTAVNIYNWSTLNER